MNQDEAHQDETASIQTVAIGDLKDPGDSYPRFQPNSEVVERYQELLDNMPPIIVAKSDDPSLSMRIVDGVHRWTAAQRDGRKSVKCEFVTVNSAAAFLAEAAARNSRHGMPLTADEQQAVAVKLWEAHQGKAQIAVACGRSIRTIERWLLELAADHKATAMERILELHDGNEHMPFTKIKKQLRLKEDESTIRRWYWERRGKAESTGDENASPGEAPDAAAPLSDELAVVAESAAPSDSGGDREQPAAGAGETQEELQLALTAIRTARTVITALQQGEPCRLTDSNMLKDEVCELAVMLNDLLAASEENHPSHEELAQQVHLEKGEELGRGRQLPDTREGATQ